MSTEQQDSDREQKITRRIFVQYSATIASSSFAIGAIALKTDALAQVPAELGGLRSDEKMPYQYQP
jgi:hypothetical protein